MKHKKEPNAVYKKGNKTSSSDSHTNNRQSVFNKSPRSKNPLDILMSKEIKRG